MAEISPPKTLPLMLIVVCMAILVPTGQAQIPGLLPPVPELQKCWAALAGTPGCLMEIYTYFLGGQIGKIGPVCCATIAQVSEDCWPKMFPINPFFPLLLKTACAAPSPTSPGANAAMSKVLFPGLFPGIANVTEIIECWSSLADIEGCVSEIYQSILDTGLIGKIGPACCKAVTEINDKCWPKIFPFNPFLPPLLKSTCSMISPGLNSGNHRILELSHCEYSVSDRFQRSSGLERGISELGVIGPSTGRCGASQSLRASNAAAAHGKTGRIRRWTHFRTW
ncbi:hypothetical protein LWI28_021457 [Acer negundo]|uniref:Prolamin-like domain-containing protein n=1 Tax=Acer negundo TaxID=4023 RepID=A0AAD5NZM5_ACENE|nr:hypothetical protein LWI28_021457 [Acer negundo]